MPNKIFLLNHQRRFAVPKKELEHFLVDAFNYHAVHFDEVNFHFVGKKKISALHSDFFNDPTLTDCITLQIDLPVKERTGSDFIHLGDVFVCPDVAFDYSEEKGIPYVEELARYLIHGMLHLLGYNDISSTGRKEMRRLERLHLKRFFP